MKFLFLEIAEGTSELAKLQEQFNAQRARMKELYLHKEKEIVQMKQKMILLKKELDEKESQLGKLSSSTSLSQLTPSRMTNALFFSHSRI